MSLNAGARDRLVTIEGLTESTDSGGFPVESWQPLLPAEWMWKSDQQTRDRAAERFDANQWSARTFVEFQHGFRADMDPEVVNVPKARRLVYRSRVYQIVQAGRLPDSEGYGIQLITMDSQSGQGPPSP